MAEIITNTMIKKISMNVYIASNGGAIKYEDGEIIVKESEDALCVLIGREILAEIKHEECVHAELDISLELK